VVGGGEEKEKKTVVQNLASSEAFSFVSTNRFCAAYQRLEGVEEREEKAGGRFSEHILENRPETYTINYSHIYHFSAK